MVTFAPDETVHILNVTVVNDGTFENTEMFTAMLTATRGSMIGAADTATATIIDDDSKLSFISVYFISIQVVLWAAIRQHMVKVVGHSFAALII